MPELSRSLQPRHITMISIGGMIGAGLFVSSSAAIAATGPAIVLSYLITGTLVLLVMRMLGEMAVSLPQVRSFSEFARAGLGPWAGFVAGWLYWYFWMIVVPVEAIAGANILQAWFAPYVAVPAWALGLVLMGIMTAVNLMSARSYGEFEFWFASIKVAAILVFIALAALFAFGLTSPAGPTFANLTAHGGFMPKGPVAVLAGAVTVYFSLTGAEITTIAAAESREPARAVARMSSTVIVRILEQGQFRLSEDQHGRLNELDNAVATAVAASDEAAFRSSLAALLDFVRTHGERVGDAELVTSDHVLPHSEITLAEAREAFAGEGAIPG